MHDFQAGSVELKKFIGGSNSYKFHDFQIFLKVLEVYGTGYLDDVDKNKYNQRQQQTHE